MTVWPRAKWLLARCLGLSKGLPAVCLWVLSFLSRMALRVVLRDGRQLAWRTYGDQTGGFPVIFAHGNLNSRLFEPSWEKTVAQTLGAGAHVIALDRPGYGESSAHKGRTYSDFAEDVVELADHLKLSSFAVVGYSSGGPHAMAVMAHAGARCRALSLVSSDAPYAELGMVEQMYGAPEVTLEYALQKAAENAASMRAGYHSMGNKERRDTALADVNNATATSSGPPVYGGLHGAASDSVLEASASWSFKLESLRSRAASVLLWHGSDDKDVPLRAGQHIAEKTGGQLVEIAGENHTLIRRHWQAILQKTVDAATGGAAGAAKL